MVEPRCARLRLPPGTQALAAPASPPDLGSPPRAGWAPGAALAASRLSRGGRRAAIGPDLERPPRPDLRSSSCASSSLAPSDLRRNIQSAPRFRGEGDSDGSAGRKVPGKCKPLKTETLEGRHSRWLIPYPASSDMESGERLPSSTASSTTPTSSTIPSVASSVSTGRLFHRSCFTELYNQPMWLYFGFTLTSKLLITCVLLLSSPIFPFAINFQQDKNQYTKKRNE
ncbi:uncharacterized protein LOC130680109 [Manis pentadactyla]|uniref:uncharacterized protein LOC130680109 n=1 Tax=Manis pentadactyla TaxID=143292 RepID=UPI00255C40C4|nr:uncharacterized protein LOC130680109 [Manis pentadactyla]